MSVLIRYYGILYFENSFCQIHFAEYSPELHNLMFSLYNTMVDILYSTDATKRFVPAFIVHTVKLWKSLPEFVSDV